MRKIRLTKQEKAIEDSLLKGEYIRVNAGELETIAQAVASRKKDAVLNIRVNSRDLKSIKEKAHKLGIRYQTLISELIHRVAQAN
ncbi:MAG: antitoxin [Candidatus Omnitrophota bacterium]